MLPVFSQVILQVSLYLFVLFQNVLFILGRQPKSTQYASDNWNLLLQRMPQLHAVSPLPCSPGVEIQRLSKSEELAGGHTAALLPSVARIALL